jgi:hypothetical protein
MSIPRHRLSMSLKSIQKMIQSSYLDFHGIGNLFISEGLHDSVFEDSITCFGMWFKMLIIKKDGHGHVQKKLIASIFEEETNLKNAEHGMILAFRKDFWNDIEDFTTQEN